MLQANCCSLVPLALLKGVEEASVLAGEARHRCQDAEKAPEGQCKIKQAGRHQAAWLHQLNIAKCS